MNVGVLVIMALAQAPASSTTLSGQVVDAQGRPAAGIEVMRSVVRLSKSGGPVLARAKSDRDGRFRFDVPAVISLTRANLPMTLWAYAPEAGLAGQAFLPSALPAEGSVQLKLGGPAHTAVRVVGPDGKPVAGARVSPITVRVAGGIPAWSKLPVPFALEDRLAATTDPDGTAQIQGCRAEDVVAVAVKAAGFGRQGSELSPAAGGTPVITLKPAGRLTGRVQVDDPSAARGLEVIAWTTPQASAGPQVEDMGRTTTDAEGRFEFPALAAGKLELNVSLAEGSKLRPEPPSGLTIEPGKTTEVIIPMEGPPRERTVAGRVVDRTGQPVAGATVFQSGDSPARTEATTGADGRFAIRGVAALPTFLFARKPGYRFGGLAIAPESQDVTLAIHKLDEPARLVRKTLPPPLPRPEEVALARRLLDPYAERALQQGGQPEKIRTLEALARIEPERALELIQQKKVSNVPYVNAVMGLRVAMGLIDESIDEALAVVEGLEDPASKAMGYIAAGAKLGAANRGRALEVLDQALLNARAAKQPDGVRLLLMGQVAEQFLDLGQAERGRAILREGEALAKQLPRAGFADYAHGAFAEELAQIDLEAALALTKDIANAHGFDRHHGNIAHELGGRDPAQSERVLALVKDSLQRDWFAIRVVYRMATVDLARARRLAEAIGDDGLKGFALGMIALGLAESGQDTAREVLASAYESLEQSSRVSREERGSAYEPTSVAGVILPVAERIDPGLVDEYLWRSLAMRQPNPWETSPPYRPAVADVQLAMMLARYDRAIARSLIASFAREGNQAAAFLSQRGELYVAAAVIDPKWAVALVESLPDDADVKLQDRKNSARLAVANVLGRAGDQRSHHLQHSFLRLWVPDIEDVDTSN